MTDKLYYLIRGRFHDMESVIIVTGLSDRYYNIEKVLKGNSDYLLHNCIICRTDRGIKKLATSDSFEEIMEMAMMEVL